MLTFKTHNNFEYILIYSLLSQKTVSFVNPKTEFSKSFCTLLQNITMNSRMDEKKDELIFYPGTILGGKLVFTCIGSITSYLLPLIVLAPFSRTPFQFSFKGITNGKGMSIDAFKRCIARTATDFEIDCHVKILKRGFEPSGEGEILFSCNIVHQLKAIDRTGDELVKIRGLAISAHLNASVTHKLINNMRDKLKLLTGDIKMHVDIANKRDSGPSPGYACIIFAENNSGNCIYGESCNKSSDSAIKDLLIAIKNTGFYDYRAFNTVASFMCLSSEDYGRVSIKRLEKEDIDVLELLNIFFGFEYKLDANEDEVFFGAFGIGYKNIFKIVN